MLVLQNLPRPVGASGEADPRATLFRLPALVLDFVNT